MNHHDTLIDQACKDGWIRGHAWYSALKARADAHDQLSGEWAELAESISFIECPRPDAWRMLTEGAICVVSFLEVEVTSGITEEKDALYRFLWDVFDATAHYRLLIWHMDRFGVARPYITDSTYAPMAFGMNAGWSIDQHTRDAASLGSAADARRTR